MQRHRISNGMHGFLVKSSIGIAIAALALLTPFGINNFLQGRYLLGLGSIIIIAVVTLHAWFCMRGRYYPQLTLLGLVPAIIFFLAQSYQQQGVIGALWSFPAIISFYYILPERLAWLANAILLVVVLLQAWLVLEPSLVLRIAITLFTVSIFTAIFVHHITRQQLQLEEQVITDPLTGVYNRTLLSDTLENAIEQSRRLDIPMTLICIDIDHFKAINDSYGHDAGDHVLSGLGRMLKQSIRGTDSVFRLGGEEFILLLFDADQDSGRQVAEKLRQEIAAYSFIDGHQVTASLGVATLQSESDWNQWIKRGDENLYRAKQAGRNQVV